MKSRSQNRFYSALLLVSVAGLLWASDDTPPSMGPGRGPQEVASQPAALPSSKDEFAQMDGDGDGRISPAEYAASPQSAIDRIAAGKRNGPAGITGGFDLINNEGRPDRSRFFKKLDANDDGYISRDEMSKAGDASAKPEPKKP